MNTVSVTDIFKFSGADIVRRVQVLKPQQAATKNRMSRARLPSNGCKTDT